MNLDQPVEPAACQASSDSLPQQEPGNKKVGPSPRSHLLSSSKTCTTQASSTEYTSASSSSFENAPEAASTDNDDSQRSLDCGRGRGAGGFRCEKEAFDRPHGTPHGYDDGSDNGGGGDDPFDESVLADLGFMMEGARAGEMQVLEWVVPVPVATTRRRRPPSNRRHSDPEGDGGANGTAPSAAAAFRVQVVAHSIDEEPGAVQSGHYLWPGARILVNYLVDNHHQHHEAAPAISSMVELGSGCAVSTLACLQLYQSTVQVAVCTDHDPGVLERARDGYESTMEHLFSTTENEDELNDMINCLASIPVLFEPLEWGSARDAESISSILKQHTVDESDRCDVVLGSDLIYSSDVVLPLLTTASLLLNESTGRFVLSQSFAYDEQAEAAIAGACERLGLVRTILWQNDTGEERVQEFRRRI
jgi:predicted nicotinamide N-methyase